MNELFLNPEHFIQLCRLRATSRCRSTSRACDRLRDPLDQPLRPLPARYLGAATCPVRAHVAGLPELALGRPVRHTGAR